MIFAYSDWHCLVSRHQLSPLLLQGGLLSSRAKAGPPSSAGVCVAVLARFWWVVWPWQSPRTFFMRQVCCSLCCSFPPYPEFCHGTPWGGVGVLSQSMSMWTMPGVVSRWQTAQWAGRSRVSEDAVELSRVSEDATVLHRLSLNFATKKSAFSVLSCFYFLLMQRWTES